MKPIIYIFSVLMVAALALSSCNSGVFSEEVPGYPTFELDVNYVDFGEVIMHEEELQTVTVRNAGTRDSKLYLYFYVEGNDSYRLLEPVEEEIVLTPGEGSYPIELGFVPNRNCELSANLVIYYAFRPLADDLDVTTRRVTLSGVGVFQCVFPVPESGTPKPEVSTRTGYTEN